MYRELIDQMHFNQSDMVLLGPLEQYIIHRQQWPKAQYVDYYLVNVWLAMQFLVDEKLCSNPELQIGIKHKLDRCRQIIDYKLL